MAKITTLKSFKSSSKYQCWTHNRHKCLELQLFLILPIINFLTAFYCYMNTRYYLNAFGIICLLLILYRLSCWGKCSTECSIVPYCICPALRNQPLSCHRTPLTSSPLVRKDLSKKKLLNLYIKLWKLGFCCVAII